MQKMGNEEHGENIRKDAYGAEKRGSVQNPGDFDGESALLVQLSTACREADGAATSSDGRSQILKDTPSATVEFSILEPGQA